MRGSLFRLGTEPQSIRGCFLSERGSSEGFRARRRQTHCGVIGFRLFLKEPVDLRSLPTLCRLRPAASVVPIKWRPAGRLRRTDLRSKEI